jgi:hypothetical protein
VVIVGALLSFQETKKPADHEREPSKAKNMPENRQHCSEYSRYMLVTFCNC